LKINFMSLENIKSDRIKKLQALKDREIDPYPAKTGNHLPIGKVLEDFENISKSEESVDLAGRLKRERKHGGSFFADLEDESGLIQIYFKKDELGEDLYREASDLFDAGDFVKVSGKLFATHKGEKTLLVKSFCLLAKAINQLPDKWHGLKDVEERFRRRYLDLAMNKEVFERFKKRGEIIKKIREFLEKEGFLEVETPVLQPLPGGALAKPFKTHLNALDMDLYLRVSPELYLKRLLVGGFEKVYELGRCFRNEGMDKSHNPDFTMLEFYWAYADYEQLMELTEKMFVSLIPEKEIEFQGHKISAKTPFKRISMRDLILEEYKIDIDLASKEELIDCLKSAGEKIGDDIPGCKIIDEIFKTIRPRIIEPTFVINHPLEMSPLAKANPKNPREAARFQLLIAGMEMVNAYCELNDPQEQAKRMKQQEEHRGDEERQRFDEDFVEALEYGMPPAAGFGMGIDRLVMLLTDTPVIREVILFPTMREK